MRYDGDTRPDLSGLTANAIVVSTSVLQTGANPPPIKLVLLFGLAYFVDGLLQGAGRAGRSQEEHGHAVLLSTPFAIEEALKYGKRKQGLLDVECLVRKGGDFQKSIAEWYDPVAIMSYEEELPKQAKQRAATHADILSVQRALQVSSTTT